MDHHISADVFLVPDTKELLLAVHRHDKVECCPPFHRKPYDDLGLLENQAL
jgi:hypothetical protein